MSIWQLYPPEQEIKKKGKRLEFNDGYYDGTCAPAPNDNIPDGFGIFTKKNSADKYEGDWVMGYPEGQGRTEYQGGQVYDGSYKQGLRDGNGTYTCQEYTYVGDWERGLMHGTGVLDWKDGRKYDGQFANNKFEGEGKYYYRNGNVYTGPFKQGKKHGKGQIEIPNKGIYKGFWEMDQEIGAATFQSKTGDTSVIGTWDLTQKSFLPKKSEIKK